MKKKKLIYFIAVYPDEGGYFMADFPDFPNMAPDYGKSFEDCIEQSTLFLDSVVSDLAERGKPIPEPAKAEELKSKLDPELGAPFCIVPVAVYPPAATERIQLTGKGDLIAQISDYAKRHHVTRSELMIQATLEHIRANG